MTKVQFLILILTLTLSSSIYSKAQSDIEEVKTDNKPNILFVPGINDSFYTTMERGLRTAAEKYNVNITISEYPQVWSDEEQIAILKKTLSLNKYDLLIISPTFTESIISSLREIHNNGIEIMTLDTFIGDGDYSVPSEFSFPLTHIGTDNFLGGFNIAEEMALMLDEKGIIYVINTIGDTSSVMARESGFRAGMSHYPNIELIVEYCQNNQELAREMTLAALQENPDISGIFGVNVFCAQGSYEAVVNVGLTGTIRIASWDATESLIKAIKDGQIDLVLAQKPVEMAELAIEWASKYFYSNVDIPKKVLSGFEFFTAENVDDPNIQKYIYWE
ncbi:substrate-binding domain-containing protein [Oceanispirochaeta crateris]|nr:substrate-binding domain-containing protein [Oceanispirochaeta crateris]